jgi:hypothetical protein
MNALLAQRWKPGAPAQPRFRRLALAAAAHLRTLLRSDAPPPAPRNVDMQARAPPHAGSRRARGLTPRRARDAVRS